jgi:hypothetical protein
LLVSRSREASKGEGRVGVLKQPSVDLKQPLGWLQSARLFQQHLLKIKTLGCKARAKNQGGSFSKEKEGKKKMLK